MVHVPQGIAGWTIFATGMLIVLFRIHGIDAPRAWIEFVEHQFLHTRAMRFVGLLLVLGAAGLGYITIAPKGIMLWLFVVSITMLALIGLCLAIAPNHAHHLILATAESEDKKLRISSILIVLAGLALALAPWFF